MENEYLLMTLAPLVLAALLVFVFIALYKGLPKE